MVSYIIKPQTRKPVIFKKEPVLLAHYGVAMWKWNINQLQVQYVAIIVVIISIRMWEFLFLCKKSTLF